MTYTPTAGFTGTDTFTYTVKDNDGAISNGATVTVTVQPSPPTSLPTATIDSITPSPATVGQTVTFTGHGNDTDGTITAYEWSSSINGVLSTSTSTPSPHPPSLQGPTPYLSVSRMTMKPGQAPVTSSLTVTDGSEYQLTLEATYSTDVKNSGTKYYHDGNDWVGRSSTSGISGQQIGGTSRVLTLPGISSPLRYGSTRKAKPDLPEQFPSTAMAHPTVRTTPRLIPVPWYTARLPELPMHPYLSLPQDPGPSG